MPAARAVKASRRAVAGRTALDALYARALAAALRRSRRTGAARRPLKQVAALARERLLQRPARWLPLLKALGSRRTVASYPPLVAEWDPLRNGERLPWQVSRGSAIRLWWRCRRGPDHRWQQSANARTAGAGCPFCAGKRLSVTNSLAARAPRVARQWHPTRNGALTPRQLTAGSRRAVWWRCPRGPDHQWKRSVKGRTAGHGCPFCAGRRVSITNALATTHPAVAALWHPRRNGRRTPGMVVAGSTREVWWRCPRAADHEWVGRVSDRAARGAGCPFCAGRRLSRAGSLAARAPAVARQWHPTRNGDLTPAQVIAGGKRRRWWKCPRGPDHEWQAAPYDRVSGARSGCPFCSNHRISVTNALATCAPALARQWHPLRNGALTPRQVQVRDRRPVFWRCAGAPAHVFRMTVAARIKARPLGGCPLCRRAPPRRRSAQ